MSSPNGYTGKILWVNLSTNELKDEYLDEKIYRKYMVGYGLGVYYIYTRITPGCDPLGPDNILGFIPGLLCLLSLSSTTKFFLLCRQFLFKRLRHICHKQYRLYIRIPYTVKCFQFLSNLSVRSTFKLFIFFLE